MIIFNIIGILMIAFSAFLTYQFAFKREVFYEQLKLKTFQKNKEINSQNFGLFVS
jgi:hypothetical protein